MVRIKYMILLTLSLLFSSCLRFPNTEKPRFICALDKAVYRTSENIVLSYTFDGYNGNMDIKNSETKTYGEIELNVHKLLPGEAGDIVENKSFQVIDAGNLAKRYEDDTLYVRLFNNSEGVPLDGKIVISIDEPGRYRLNVFCIIQPEGYNYDGPKLLVSSSGNYFAFTVR